MSDNEAMNRLLRSGAAPRGVIRVESARPTATDLFVGRAHAEPDGSWAWGPPPVPVVRSSAVTEEREDMNAVLREVGALRKARKQSRWGW
jgi:hypothetical protein